MVALLATVEIPKEHINTGGSSKPHKSMVNTTAHSSTTQAQWSVDSTLHSVANARAKGQALTGAAEAAAQQF